MLIYDGVVNKDLSVLYTMDSGEDVLLYLFSYELVLVLASWTLACINVIIYYI